MAKHTFVPSKQAVCTACERNRKAERCLASRRNREPCPDKLLRRQKFNRGRYGVFAGPLEGTLYFS